MREKLDHTILLVDDEPNILVPLEFLVKKEGYKTLTASNGKEALDVLQKNEITSIILDVMMPEMGGFEVAGKIRQNPKWNDVSIIFLTAKGTAEDKINGYNSGGEVYLTKPFENDELITTLNEVVEFGK